MHQNNPFEQVSPSEVAMIQGQKVEVFSPVSARITIKCPFPHPRIGETPTLEQKVFVMSKTQNIINYMLAEGILDNKNGKEQIGIEVLTDHNQPL